MNVTPGKIISLFCRCENATEQKNLTQYESFLKTLAKIDEIHILSENENPPISATALVKQFEIFVPLAGLIDKDAEMARLNKEIEKIKANLRHIQGKLENANFIKNAPPVVVEKDKALLLELQNSLEGFENQKRRLEEI